MQKIKSNPIFHRYGNNPLLTKEDIPYPSTYVSNPGVVYFNKQYYMILKNVHMLSETEYKYTINHGLARSKDGIKWQLDPNPCFGAKGKELFDLPDDEVKHVHDPRLMVINETVYITIAIATKHGLLCGIAKTNDFKTWEQVTISTPDNRNVIIFPEKINGLYYRLERPFPVYSRGGDDQFDIWISQSPDLVHWGQSKILLAVEDVPFANNKLGPGTPAIKTDKGWLFLFHAVDKDDTRGKNGWEDKWQKRYTAGVMLVDLNDPSKIIGFSKKPLIVPEADYEISGGYRNNVIFPTGLIADSNGDVKIYYGAADTVICLASANINELINACL
jgi:beta-1,4-mannooligosaccharide/beta-1,4-mannosyl-N-acetylglucosamine phosphorylase